MSAAGMARYAERYAEIGLVLTWTAPGERGPRHKRWNLLSNAITSPATAREHFQHHPDHGIAVLLSYSNLVSLDIDDIDRSRLVFAHVGIDLDALRHAAPCIAGRHFRILYRAPDEPLELKKLKWPRQGEPHKCDVVFELRAGPVADTLPPTIHPVAGRPYSWEIRPTNGFPPLPDRLLDIWNDWEKFHAIAQSLCPWARPAPARAPPGSFRPRRPAGPSVIDAFNAAHDVAAILEAHGYQPHGKRWSSPDTGHASGIVLLDDGRRIYCHHAGDALGDGHAHDAFDVFRLLDYHGDYRAAVKAAANVLGLNDNIGHQ